ncbi:hypothetical protein SAMN05216349_12239 [Oribacterium sp. KHPX15]|uniref:DUF2194 domain-containing protein n=1 Tax=Oribacterium sp. KHPX15 TaxID=1855342 RepID=UPI00089C6F95|nr:DUF2194 domain-containing protein [Oribacterium sp. KHPX15]SEA68014.1 hypothetical protein SAMN05216349_12239 [Oribacterium sp. KHPX15]
MDNENINHKHKRRNTILAKAGFDGLYIIGAVFCLAMAALVLLQMNIQYSIRPDRLSIMSKEELSRIKTTENATGVVKASGDGRVLVVFEDVDDQSNVSKTLWIPLLNQMKIPYDALDITDFRADSLKTYDKLVLAITNYQKLMGDLEIIKKWVANGGNMMIAYPPSFSGEYSNLFSILGVKDCGGSNALVECLHFPIDFMIGGTKHDFPITDPYDASMSYSLEDDCTVYLETSEKYPTPLIWRRNYGKGSVVVDNFGYLEKAYRGIHSSAFSLLGDYCAYPVINGAVFYIDDFPSPVPEGDNTYIKRDYNIPVGDFYMQIWWNDLYKMAKQYGIDYTGLVIEDYSDVVSGAFPRNYETSQFLYYGNMLLDEGGEIGIHGYNHMPLVLENFDYQDKYDSYVPWPTTNDIKKSLREVFDFTHKLFPNEELNVYVPPSNILSKEGRQILSEETTTRCIASIYFPGEMCFEQEFDISEDGMINAPRVTSGCIIDDYMKIAALSELNFHLVNSHFHHPDDVLDEDRGAKLGWKTLHNNLLEYFGWLYTSCPAIRNLTGTELSGAIERYDLIKVNREYTGTDINLNFSSFYDEAWMLVRINNGKSIHSIVHGNYTKVAENLYLVECTGDNVDIKLTS